MKYGINIKQKIFTDEQGQHIAYGEILVVIDGVSYKLTVKDRYAKKILNRTLRDLGYTVGVVDEPSAAGSNALSFPCTLSEEIE